MIEYAEKFGNRAAGGHFNVLCLYSELIYYLFTVYQLKITCAMCCNDVHSAAM